jgi:hypothetical protein
MALNSPLAGQSILPHLVAWLIVLVSMFFGFRAVGRVTRQRFPWLYGPRMTYVGILVTIIGITLMMILVPPRKLVPANQDTTPVKLGY